MAIAAGNVFGRLTTVSRASVSTWTVLCECGVKKDVPTQALRDGRVVSCGCYRRELQAALRRQADVIGQKFGKLTVLKEIRHPSGQLRQECECECGERVHPTKNQLTTGRTTSCGCDKNYADVTGLQFYNLTAIGTVRNLGAKLVVCQCCCGNTCEVPISKLRTSKVRSCGCQVPETVTVEQAGVNLTVANTSAMQSGIYLPASWWAMLSRVSPDSREAANYYRRGITVSEEWQNSFNTFAADVGLRPINTSLDRINNDGMYCKDNCRWATPTEQARNTERAGELKKGVRSLPDGRWRAVLKVHGKSVLDRIVSSYEDAVAIRLKAEETFW